MRIFIIIIIIVVVIIFLNLAGWVPRIRRTHRSQIHRKISL